MGSGAGAGQPEDGAASGQAPLARSGGEGAHASGAISITPQMTPCTSPQTSPMGSPLASCLPEVKPFDMWAGQAEEVRLPPLATGSRLRCAAVHLAFFLWHALSSSKSGRRHNDAPR